MNEDRSDYIDQLALVINESKRQSKGQSTVTQWQSASASAVGGTVVQQLKLAVAIITQDDYSLQDGLGSKDVDPNADVDQFSGPTPLEIASLFIETIRTSPTLVKCLGSSAQVDLFVKTIEEQFSISNCYRGGLATLIKRVGIACVCKEQFINSLDYAIGDLIEIALHDLQESLFDITKRDQESGGSDDSATRQDNKKGGHSKREMTSSEAKFLCYLQDKMNSSARFKDVVCTNVSVSTADNGIVITFKKRDRDEKGTYKALVAHDLTEEQQALVQRFAKDY